MTRELEGSMGEETPSYSILNRKRKFHVNKIAQLIPFKYTLISLQNYSSIISPLPSRTADSIKCTKIGVYSSRTPHLAGIQPRCLNFERPPYYYSRNPSTGQLAALTRLPPLARVRCPRGSAGPNPAYLPKILLVPAVVSFGVQHQLAVA